MTPDDLARTHCAAFATSRGWSAQEFAQLLSTPGIILCGDAKSFILGRVTFDEAEILTVATYPAHRRQGLARAALTAFDKVAHDQGAVSAFLEVAADNAAANALYLSEGYAQVGRRKGYYKRPSTPAVDALVLRKPYA